MLLESKRENGYMTKQKTNARPAIFLDRDGVLNQDLGYVYQFEESIIPPSVPSALKLLKSQNYLLIVITNQAGIARGFYNEEDVHKFHERMQHFFHEKSGVLIDAFYYCPHHPKGSVSKYAINCNCRKPKTGMIEQAIKEFSIDIENSFLIGDKVSDIDCGKNMGINSLQIFNNQYEKHNDAWAYATSLVDAVDIINSRLSR